jgi:hypothetical protein
VNDSLPKMRTLRLEGYGGGDKVREIVEDAPAVGAGVGMSDNDCGADKVEECDAGFDAQDVGHFCIGLLLCYGGVVGVEGGVAG